MASLRYEDLRAEYEAMFDTCRILPERLATVGMLGAKIVASQARYQGASTPLGIPWQLVGVIHCMETGLRFDRHLHNGDPLSARTVHVPAGRPLGVPPFSWEESARDALMLERLHVWKDWSLPGMLYCIEGYNGWGYRKHHPDVPTPYLWSFSTHYVRGKYVADGSWSASAVSQQCGAAVLLRWMQQQGGPIGPAAAPPVP